jgi:hypothetical protein
VPANRWLQIQPSEASRQLAGKRVLVKELGDGTLRVLRDHQPLAFKRLAWRPQTARARVVSQRPITTDPAARRHRRYGPA